MKFQERRRPEQIELGQDDDAGYEEPRRTQMYSQVAESTPMLLVDNEYHDEDESDMESDIELEANRHTTTTAHWHASLYYIVARLSFTPLPFPIVYIFGFHHP